MQTFTLKPVIKTQQGLITDIYCVSQTGCEIISEQSSGRHLS